MRKYTIRALTLGLAAGVLLGLFQTGRGPQLADKLIRLHVVAASDSPEDQADKLAVRDSVLAAAAPMLAQAGSVTEARQALETGLPAFRAAAEETLRSRGVSAPVTVSLEQTRFPAKDYETFSLPAGQYEALRVVIGPGEGHNWWCVVYPQLCLCATTREVETAAAAAGFTPAEISAITSPGGVVFRWRILELWRAWFG